jgi:trimeric autotransporter adhesin
MPKLSLRTPTAGDGYDFSSIDWNDYSEFSTVTSGTLLRYLNEADSKDFWEISGRGLTLGDTGITGGTITELRLFQGNPAFQAITVTGLSLTAAKFSEMLQSSDPLTVLLSGADEITGTSADDKLYGFAGNDTLRGGGGSDTFYGGFGNDHLDGTAASNDANDHDIADYSFGTVRITMALSRGRLTVSDGMGGTDTLTDIEEVRGTIYNDTLVSNSVLGGETRYLMGLAGADRLIGGAGTDIAQYQADEFSLTAAQRADLRDDDDYFGVIANLTATEKIVGGTSYKAGAIKDVYNHIDETTNIEGIEGTGFRDKMWGGRENNIFSGRVGEDRLDGGEGADQLSGGEDNDILIGGSGNDWLIGGAGSDEMDGGTGNDWLDFAREAADQLDDPAVQGVVADFTQEADGDGYISITDSHGETDLVKNFEAITGTNKADTIKTANIGENIWFEVAGLGGNDAITGSAGLDRLRYDMEFARGGKFGIIANLAMGTVTDGFGNADTVSAIDSLYATGLNDTLTGGAGDETFAGFAGDDIINGGGGRNTVTYEFDHDFGQGLLNQAKWGTGSSGMVGVTVNLVTGTARDGLGGMDTLSNIQVVHGTRYIDSMTAAATGSELHGLGGNDTLNGGAGDDILNGGAGVDTMRGGGGNDIFHVDSLSDRLFENAAEGTDTVMTSINWTLAANFENLTLTGAALNGTGNLGANILTGNALNNQLDGLGGADTLIGEQGNDTYIVDSIADIVTELADEGTDTVRTSANFTLSDHVENLVLAGNGHINGTGNALANVITGNVGNNVIDGGAGADRLDGGHGIDTLSYAASSGSVSVNLGTGAATGGDAEGDIIRSFENLTGSDHDDELTGNTLANRLIGGAGADTITGGAGADTLTGGEGDDIFVFARGFGRDVITDFDQGSDTIRIADSLLRDFNRDGARDLSDLVFAAKTSGLNLILQLDGASSITFTGLAGTQLTEADFQLI